MKKKILTLMLGTLLLLTACGQTGDSSPSTMLPVTAVQSVVQAVTPMEDKMQQDVDSLLVGEDTEEAEPAGDEETPKPTKDAATRFRQDGGNTVHTRRRGTAGRAGAADYARTAGNA